MQLVRKGNVWLFLGLTLLITWLFWLPMVGRENAMEGPGAFVVLLGGFVPSAMGVLFVYLTGDRDTRRQFWRRVFNVKQVGWLGLAFIAGYPLLLYGGSILAYRLGTGTSPSPSFVIELLGAPGNLLGFIIIGMLAGPVSEELGWRGYALDTLLARYNSVLASLVLGLVWWAWHIPLFFIPGIGLYDLGFFSVDGIAHLIGTVCFSIVMTLLYLRTSRSILAAILMHFTVNAADQLILGAGDDLGIVWTISSTVVNLLLAVAAIVLLTSRYK
jgi:membrane protease YdiL (CAAX protease family)